MRGDVKENQLHLQEEVNRVVTKEEASYRREKETSVIKDKEVRKGTVSFVKDNAGVDAYSNRREKAAPARRQRINAATCSRCRSISERKIEIEFVLFCDCMIIKKAIYYLVCESDAPQ